MSEKRNLAGELSRLRAASSVTASRLKWLRLKSTGRALSTELQLLRRMKAGPTFVVRRGQNSRMGFFYRFEEVLSFFGGADAVELRKPRSP